MSLTELLNCLSPLSMEEQRFGLSWVEGPLSSPSGEMLPSIDELKVTLMERTDNADDAHRVQLLVSKLVRKCANPEIARRIIFFLSTVCAGNHRKIEVPLDPASIRQAPMLTIPLIKTEGPSTLFDTISLLSVDPSQPSTVSEIDLVRDLVYVMQGIEGSNVTVSKRHQFAPHVVGGIAFVEKFGRTFSSLKERVQRSKNSSDIARSLACAAEKQLLEFQGMAAVIESDLGNWTLLKLLVWLRFPFEKLRYIDALVGVSTNSGSDTKLLNALHAFTLKPVFHSISSSVFATVLRDCWLRKIESWVRWGELGDGFFIGDSKQEQSNSSYRLWTSRFSVEKDAIPSFLPEYLAHDALLIGKSVAFVRNCCSEDDWFELRNEMNEVVADSTGLDSSFSTLSCLKKDLTSVGAVVTSVPVNLLLRKYRLIHHCENIVKYVVLCDGAFANLFVARVSASKSLNRYELSYILDTAVRDSVAGSPDAQNELLDRLSVMVSREDAKSVSSHLWTQDLWIDYAVAAPLDVIFHEKTKHKLQQCFAFAARLVWCEIRLTESWKELTEANRACGGFVDEETSESATSVSTLLKQMHYLRSHLWFFVHELRAVVNYEVVDTEWRVLEDRLAGPTISNVNEIITAHDTFVDNVLKGMFLDDPVVSNVVSELLDIVTRYLSCESNITGELVSLAASPIEDSNLVHRLSNIRNLIDDILESLTETSSKFLTLLEQFSLSQEDVKRQELVARILARLKGFE